MRRSTLLALPLVAMVLAAAPAAAAARVLRVGSRGSDVVRVQSALSKLGYRLDVDGIFGRRTRRAVRRYERAHHLRIDGVVPPREARAIRRAAGAATATGGGTPAPSGEPAPPDGAHAFPVLGSFSFGDDANRFGAPRGNHTHQGQDILAAEGTPIVSFSAGTVHWRAYQAAAAGNYVVVRGSDGFDYAYMHLRERALVAPGDHVDAGQQLGFVGHTGDASAPHLHFEVWTAHWQDGGHPVDPLPYLKSWLPG